MSRRHRQKINSVTTILSDDPNPYVLLLPRRIGGTGWQLECFWQGSYNDGFSQATQGGYSAFRVLARKEAVTTGSYSNGLSISELITGSFVALIQSRESRLPTGQVGCIYSILNVGTTLEAALVAPSYRHAACLVVSITAIGFPDGGVATGVRINGSSISFLTSYTGS